MPARDDGGRALLRWSVSLVEPLVIALILLSALLHSGWNALVKLKGDPLVMLASVAGSATLLSLPFVLFLPFPAAGIWSYLLVSMALHTMYNLFLYAGYRHGDLGQVYPIARGVAPADGRRAPRRSWPVRR